MVLKNLVYGTFPSVIHCSGRGNPENPESWKLIQAVASSKPRPIKVPKNLSIVTVNTKPEKLLLQLQCEAAGVHLNVIGNAADWRTSGDKGPAIIQFARKISEEFMLVLDTPDVVIQGDLQECVDEIKRVGCEALVGAELNFWPDGNKFDSEHQEKMYRKPWCYLNSGLIIARREFWVGLNGVDWGSNDQGTFHVLHRTMWPKIKLDDGCRIFQNINCLATTTPSAMTDLSKLFSVVFGRPASTCP